MTEIEEKAEEYVKNKLCCSCVTQDYVKLENCEKTCKARKIYKDGYKQGQKEEHNKWCSNPTWVLQLEKENEKLKAKIEKMKCCWNCKNFNSECEYCKLDKSLRSFWDDCNKWELAE